MTPKSSHQVAFLLGDTVNQDADQLLTVRGTTIQCDRKQTPIPTLSMGKPFTEIILTKVLLTKAYVPAFAWPLIALRKP